MKTLRVFALAAFVLLAAACGALNPELTPFYTPPEPLPPGAPGEIIKTENLRTNNANVRAWRVMYHSRDVKGNDIAVTGLFAAPVAPASPDGAPLLALAHGTEGLGRQCAPSLDPWGLPPLVGDFLSFPDSTVLPFVQAGFAVTATDYQGLGAPGDASYFVGKVEAQNVLDSIRAIRRFDQIKLNDQTYVWGHSQGGHSVAFTAQLAKEIAPEIQLQGIVLAAPATQLKGLVDTALGPNTPSVMTGIAASVAASWGQSYHLPLDSVFTSEGLKQAPALYRECVIGAVLAFNSQTPKTYYFIDPTTTSPWSDTMWLNTPQAMLYPAPLFIAQGTADTVVAPQTTASFVEELCKAGNTVLFQHYPGADHLGVMKASNADVLAWLGARVRKEAAPSNCSEPGASAATPTPVLALPQEVIFTDGAFVPDDATMAQLRARLPKFLEQNQDKFNADRAPIVERLPSYTVQYRGEIENGKRVIAVNAMCTPLENWQTRWIMVLDGGDCFFQVQYDADAGSFFDLSVNGEA